VSKQNKNEKDILLEISEKLDKLVGLFAAQGKNADEQIIILRSSNKTLESCSSKSTGSR